MIIYSSFNYGTKMPAVKRLIGFLLLPVVLITAWDIAVIETDEIQFLQQNDSVGISSPHLRSIGSGTYDPVSGDVYVSDPNHQNASIFKISAFNSRNETVLIPVASKENPHYVVRIAFDPVSNALFWSTGHGRTIKKLELNHSDMSLNTQSGVILHEFSDEVPHGIAVESCEQYLFWTNSLFHKASIGRSNTNGSDRKTIVTIGMGQPLSIVVDQKTKHIYWSDGQESDHFSIERSDFDGNHREIVYQGVGISEPLAISLSRDFIFWIDHTEKELWSLSKNISKDVEKYVPMKIANFDQKTPMDLISSTLYLDVDLESCPSMKALKEKIEKNYQNSGKFKQTGTINDFAIFSGTGLSSLNDFCLNNGIKTNTGCECPKGFSGLRCETSACHNYCFRGKCELNEDASPVCSCPSGFSGSRCEIDKCYGMCLNGGSCAFHDLKVTCICKTGYSGDRCEFSNDVKNELCKTYCQNDESSAVRLQSSTSMYNDNTNSFDGNLDRLCRCSEEKISSASDRYDRLADNEDTRNQNQHLVSELNGRFNVLVTSTLTILCLILAVTVIVLSIKVYALKKRPRIRKRIVVNKPLAPITCRPQSPPDQCEITIENCCNMNICETPCFEPDFRLSKATFKKSKSEDKKMLIHSMHSNSSQDEENY